jgi:murein DD-endopeptidase MepM/ murein hydrolase activator NlpD
MKTFSARWIFLLIVMSSVSLSSVFAALTSDQAGRILENFKTLEKQMIFESDTPLLSEEDKGILDTYKRVGLYDAIGDKVQAKREYLQQQNEKIISRADSLEKSIAALDADIADLLEEVNAINARVISTRERIETNTKTIEILKGKIAKNTDILLEYMSYLYKKGEAVKSWGDIDNLKAILLSGENIDSLLNDMYFKSIIQVTGQQLLEQHRSYIGELYKKQIALKEDEQQLKALRKQGVIEKSILDDKKSQKERLLEVTKGQEELYKKYIAEKLEAERDIKVKELRERIALNNSKKKLLETYNCEFVDISNSNEESLLGLSQQCQEINKIIYAESRITGVSPWNNPFDWPVNPYLWVSAFYRDEGYQESFGTDHDAIDIVIPQGSDIKAPMDGYVIFIQPPVNSGYAYVALKHADGLVTLYGHVSEVTVDRYDFIKRGEVFAKSGGEYGTNGAWVLTSGAHLHFVVYENEEYVDPMNYLNISYLDYNNVPSRYEFKYLSDFKARKGYDYQATVASKKGNVFRIEGENEIERQKYLLNTYAVWPFRDWDIWVEESVAQGIDPTFVMCVGLAETSLGKHLKSAYNVWNVGNNDRGDTVDFPNARTGITWMVKTFNNKYLSQYDKIEELSRYGNKNGPIYASSDFNWHNNITKCMSHVKGYFIPDSYNFRVSVQ